MSNEVRTFVRDSNNSLVAVMLLEDYERMLDVPEADDCGPVFLFYPDDVLDIETRKREPWITGNYTLMSTLLAGHNVVHREIWMPFSNGHQLYSTREDLLGAFRKVGSVAEAIEAFGLRRSIGELTVVDGRLVNSAGEVIYDLSSVQTFA